MAFTWTKITNTFVINGTASPNAEEPLDDYLYESDEDFRVIKTYSVGTAGNKYRWKREIRFLDGDGDPYDAVWGEVELEQTTTRQTLRSRFAGGEWEVEWDLPISSTYPMITDFGHGTIFPAGGYGAGTRQLWETYYINDVATGPETLAGTFDIRRVTVQAYADKQLFNPLEEATTIKLDFFALPAPGDSYLFPLGWSPSGIDWELDFYLPPGLAVSDQSGSTSASSPGPDGRVATASFSWNGLTDEGDVVEVDAHLGVRVLSEVSGSGNVWTGGAGLASPECKRCRDDEELAARGEVGLSLALPVMAGLGVALSYLSGQFAMGPASLGYGWSSVASERITETTGGSLIYRNQSGIVMRWEPDGGDYIPVRPDNRTQAEKPGTPTYRLTFRDRSVKEFDSDGRLTVDIDRSGNIMSYTYSGGDLVSQSDGNGRTIYYDYGSRTDGQPVAIAPHSLSDERKFRLEYYPDTDDDAPDRLYRVIMPEGETQEFHYYAMGRIKKVVYLRPTLGDLEVEYRYDMYGRMTRKVVGGELETTYGYGPNVVMAWINDLTSGDPPPTLRSVEQQYDKFGNMTRKIENANPSVAG